MKKLTDYEILKTVFYRGVSILEYISIHPDMDELDKRAIESTIMSALVYKNCINPEEEFLDLKSLSITNNKEDYHYEEYPFVTGYPLWLKEEMRKYAIRHSGSLPISVHAARPSGIVFYCVYDANRVLSFFFDDFAFVDADYNSPTRVDIRVTDRPFLEVKMGEKTYLVDALTKRFFEREEFRRRYQLVEKYRIRNKEFSPYQKKLYAEQTEIREDYGPFLAITLPSLGMLKGYPKYEEYLHEIEESRKYFSNAWEDAQTIIENVQLFSKESISKQYVKDRKEEN